MGNPAALAQCLAAIEDDSSYLWMFWHPEESNSGEELVEARLDLPLRSAEAFYPPARWTLHHVQWDDSFFIRRTQSMTKAALRAMLIELLHHADGFDGKVHSWLHGATIYGLDDPTPLGKA